MTPIQNYQSMKLDPTITLHLHYGSINKKTLHVFEYPKEQANSKQNRTYT